MKILILSDTHLGHPGWGSFGEDVFDRATALARSNTVDVVLHCGDLVEPSNPNMTLNYGLSRLAAIPAKHHLWVAGNNDIEMVRTRQNLLQYAVLLQNYASQYQIKLLDYAPFVHNGVGFAGSFGAYNLSLWRQPKTPVPGYPNTYQDLRRVATQEVLKETGVDLFAFFQHCQDSLHTDLNRLMLGGVKVVAVTHTVPTGDMLLYGKSPAYDFQNAWMGWDDSKSARPIANVPRLLYQFAGHVHRGFRVDRPGTGPLINVSGRDQPHLFDI